MIIKSAGLVPFALEVMRDKATERPATGLYNDHARPGTYLCRQCGFALFRATTKFHSGCGWPSFDEEIKNAVKRAPDKDGKRIEILCAHCGAHLGHVFTGEGFTAKNIRHCVNSASLDFVTDLMVEDTEEAIFAAGCFWGVEYYLKRLPGVIKTEAGYCGGQVENPTYDKVCHAGTGHFEAVRVLYDPRKISYEALARYFFEIHDFTQTDGQGPDKGQHYLSAIFYYNAEQKFIAEKLIGFLKGQCLAVATQLLAVKPFWPAEEYHQNYYEKADKRPYCHHYVKRFD